jgi:hypothetical protein
MTKNIKSIKKPATPELPTKAQLEALTSDKRPDEPKVSTATEDAQMNIKVTDEILPGVYSNLMQIVHTKEEFIFDYFLNAPPQGIHVSRVIISPGHAKRFCRALIENIKKFEEKNGIIAEDTK